MSAARADAKPAVANRPLRRTQVAETFWLVLPLAIIALWRTPSSSRASSNVAEKPDVGSAQAGAKRLAPWLQSVAFLVVAAGIFGVLSLGQGEAYLVTTTAWATWKLAIGLSFVLSVVLLIQAFAVIRRLRREYTNVVTVRIVALYGAVALVLILSVFFFLAKNTMDYNWVVPHMQLRLRLVAIGIGVMAAPWLTVVWLVHTTLRSLPTVPPLHHLTGLWTLVESCTRSFAVFVVIALIPTGALRVAWLAQDPRCPAPAGAASDLAAACSALESKYPSSDVLLYGAFFAAMLVAIALPLLTSWRGRARALVDATYPQTSVEHVKDEAQRTNRVQLEEVLRLNSGLLRDPVSALAVLTPLVTSFVAAFLPQITI